MKNKSFEMNSTLEASTLLNGETGLKLMRKNMRYMNSIKLLTALNLAALPPS